MRNALKLLPALALATLPFGPLQAEDATSPETVVAVVNGKEITLGHMMILYANLPQQYQQIPVAQLFDGILEQLIQQEALAQHFDGTPPASVTLSLQNEERALLAASEIAGMLEGVTSDEAVQAAYDAQYANAEGEREWNASHILVETEAEAKAIREVLEDGADFAEVAKTSSTGPSGPSGGELGWFQAGQMVPDFETAVTALEAGEISEPVQTQFGWHVIKLNETRIAEAPTLDEVRGQIVSELEGQAIEEHVKSLTDAAEIERPDLSGVDPAALQQLDALD
ncbi:peptidylprolyl isomerase [Marinibacterium sp. SX1]|uniref:peptidylprolyl isomerase n=1 Tax=Marinibacterium sp. SX1 TaxID=3388424 RepID=UPI003D17CAC9